MTKHQKLLLLIFIATLLAGVAVWFALPYPWVPFGRWLESFMAPIEGCFCFWPWWLFTLLQILASAVLVGFLRRLVISHGRVWLAFVHVGVAVFIYHLIAHSIVLDQYQLCHESAYTPWFWLVVLLLVVGFSVFTKPKQK